eukprot:gene19937-20447_t
MVTKTLALKDLDESVRELVMSLAEGEVLTIVDGAKPIARVEREGLDLLPEAMSPDEQQRRHTAFIALLASQPARNLAVIGVDTNILVYASGFDDVTKQQVCRDLLNALKPSSIVLPLQVLAEFHRVIGRKTGDKVFASRVIGEASKTYGLIGMDAHGLTDALKLVDVHGFQIFDALILEQCARAGCEIMLTEDLHNGFRWKACTIINPLDAKSKPILTEALEKHRH